MTGAVAGAPPVSGVRRTRRLLIVAAAVVVAAVVAGLWVVGRLPGVPLRDGPLEGTNYEELWQKTKPTDTGMLWGSLVLHNSTKSDIVLVDVALADPDGIVPSAGPYIWGEDRVAMIGSAAVSGYKFPLPAEWKIPPKHAVAGYRIRPQAESDSVEVLYELPVPRRTSTIRGIAVRYRTAGITYRRTFDVILTICAPTEPERCDNH
ncbi:hypothetical protein COUCH_01885 [Couchioplanes caeruleus]|uniref:hypothetical protein n=1 Tax=Couchioplanes caeruleus TaxID=56438 RepID=UPI0020C03BBC|nr:hypothetical protein [Couchioplanes caeruleus]UQU65128.1 hypothetical protein COUCH_01885 [Couchioplanes caeruleus]